MATKVFIDFDSNLAGSQTAAPTAWVNMGKPRGVYAVSGVLSQDPNACGTEYTPHPTPGRHADSSAYGQTMLTFRTYSGGRMIGVNRSMYSIGSEVWLTADIRIPFMSFAHLDSTVMMDDPLNYVFRWGDVAVIPKSITWSGATFTAVFSVQNDEVEIATVTIPGISVAAVSGLIHDWEVGTPEASHWLFMKVHVKLHDTTGLIDVNIDGYAQSASYTGQNTVQTIAENSTGTLYTADHVYFGWPGFLVTYATQPYVLVGAIDNVGIYDTGFPAGRPNARRWTMGSSESNSGFLAVGTAATTVRDALSTPTDAKAARGQGEGASTVIALAGSFPASGLEDEFIGCNIYLKRVAKRDSALDSRISVGLSIGGIHTMGTKAVDVELPLNAPTTPPNTFYQAEGVAEGIYDAGLTLDNIGDAAVRLLVSE
jgi:hypothetical protein